MNLTDEQLVKRILECENRADCMDDETCLHMAEDVMREVMSRVKKNIVLIKDKLESKGYEFKYPDKAHAFPLDRISERIQAVESNGFFLPLSLKTWFTVVGSVNFMGSHPDWARPSYVYNPNQFDGEPWYTDPLVIEDALLEDAFTNWTDKKDFMAGVNIVQPRIPVSPDASHKSNVSGGASYEIFFAAPAIDSLLHNEPHGCNFVEYLRIACSWGGFPGVRKIDEFPKNFIRDLTSALVPF